MKEMPNGQPLETNNVPNELSNHYKCTGCGFCCIKSASACGASFRLYNGSSPCPALTWDEDKKRHWCKLGLLPGVLGEEYRKELYMNQGCCMNLNSWRREPLQNRTKTLLEDNGIVSPIPSIMQIFLKCLGSEPFISSDTMKIVAFAFESELIKHEYDPETAKIYRMWSLRYLVENRNFIFRDFTG